MYQQVTILGHLGGEPELRYTPSGTAVTTVSLATNKRNRDPQGNVTEDTTWWRVTCYGSKAENLCQYANKGDLVYAVGELQSDQTGNPRIYQVASGESRANNEMKAFFVRSLAKNEQEDEEMPAW